MHMPVFEKTGGVGELAWENWKSWSTRGREVTIMSAKLAAWLLGSVSSHTVRDGGNGKVLTSLQESRVKWKSKIQHQGRLYSVS